MTAYGSRKDKVDAALAQLHEGVEKLRTSEDWVKYLAFQARFHKYSFGNVMLIQIQRPDATQVAGYRAWQKLGRQVRKGERGIVILAPLRRTVEDEKTGERRSFLVGFTTATVFDVAQTDGDPLPEPNHQLDGDGDADLFDALVRMIEVSEGFEYVRQSTGNASLGYTDFARRRVVVGDQFSMAQAVKTTAHELAHVLMHDPTSKDTPKSRQEIEVEAESVAYVVLAAHGYDAGDYSFGYVAGWGKDADAVQATAERVRKTAVKVLESLTVDPAVEAVPA